MQYRMNYNFCQERKINMECKLCGQRNVEVTYEGYIRDGKVGNYTKESVRIYKCHNCGTIWHDCQKELNEFYESVEYRKSLEGTSDIEDFYTMHDAESMDKFIYTGTEIFRGKIVADIGCGGGAFLDYIFSVGKEVIAIEPSRVYQEEMNKKGFEVFPYAEDALEEYKNRVDIIVSFDCIEHVESPEKFVKEAYELLAPNGMAFIGTPTDAPVMRELLGTDYESFLFSTQHPWVLSRGSFDVMAEHCGITQYDCKFYQRYGLGNCLFWLQNRQPGRHKKYGFISKGMDELWKRELERQKLSDYIVFEMKK